MSKVAPVRRGSFVAGLDLKRELVVGELADRRAAALPAIAAVGGMVVPALVALAVSGGATADGGAWAIPVATDIAFALGVLALVGASLPSGVRVLLLSIAVVDDLLAIVLIAILFTADLSLPWLAGGLLAAAVYRLALRRRVDPAVLLWALAVVTWVCIHATASTPRSPASCSVCSPPCGRGQEKPSRPARGSSTACTPSRRRSPYRSSRSPRPASPSPPPPTRSATRWPSAPSPGCWSAR